MISVPHVRAKLALLVFATLGGIVLFYWWYTLAGGKPIGQARFEFNVVVPDGQQLVPNSDVTVSGVRVGQVTRIANRGPHGVVRLSIFDKNALPVYRDATVEVLAKTLVGESYVELDRGTPGAGRLPAGATLPARQGKSTILIDQALESLDPVTRRDVSADLRTLGGGLDRRGADLNGMFGALRPTVDAASTVARTLSEQRGQVAALVSHAGRVMGAVAERSHDLRMLVTAARTTAQAVAGRDRALGEAVDELPATLRQARTSVDKLAGFSNSSLPVVENLRASLVGLDPVLRDLRPTAVASRRLVDALPPLLRRADPLLAGLRRFSTAAPPAIDGVNSVLCEANPALDFLSPYARDIASFTGNFSRFHTRDRWGNMGQVHALVSDRSYQGWTPELRRLVAPLLDEGVVGKLLKTNANAYPAPGTLLHPQPFSGHYPRIERERRCHG